MEKKENNEKHEINEKINEIMKDVRKIKKKMSEGQVPSSNLGTFVSETLKQSLGVLDEIPKQIEKSLDNMWIPRETFNSQFTGLKKKKASMGKKREEIREKAEKVEAQVEELAKKLRRNIWKGVKKELRNRGMDEEKIENVLKKRTDEALREFEAKISELGKEIDEALEKGILKTRKEFKTHIKNAVETFEPGTTADILSTLASPERLQILKLLKKKGRYYTELSKKVGLGPSSLKFHLGKLKTANLITQERSRGKYFITEKGETAIRLAAYLGTLLLPSKDDPSENSE